MGVARKNLSADGLIKIVKHSLFREQFKVMKNTDLGTDKNTSKLITNKGVKKFTKTEDSQSVLDEQKIAEDMAWDGLHGVITNMKDVTSRN